MTSHSYVNWCQLSVMNYRENVVQLTGFLYRTNCIWHVLYAWLIDVLESEDDTQTVHNGFIISRLFTLFDFTEFTASYVDIYVCILKLPESKNYINYRD